jgi:hypothetical protein
MPIEIDRRDFLKIVFATTSAAAVSGAVPLWPEDAIARPVSKPFELAFDEFGCLVDPNFDYEDICWPTFRKHLSLEGLKPKALKKALNEQFGAIEHLVEDPDNWSLHEVDAWLDSEIGIDDLGPWQAASYGPHGCGLDIYQELDEDEARDLGLVLVEDGTPGSSCYFVAFHGEADDLNRQFETLAMNVVVTSNPG